MRQIHRAIYGCVVIPRAYCPHCSDVVFVIHGKYACCGRGFYGASGTAPFERMSAGTNHREKPSLEDQVSILTRQKNRCFYCGTIFGDVAIRQGRKPSLLVPNWDHVQPFCWQANNQPLNFVAACWICNGIKSDNMFASKEEAQEYVWTRRKARGWASATEHKP